MRVSIMKRFLCIFLMLALLIAAPGRVQAATSSAEIDTAWDRVVSYSYNHPAMMNTFLSPWMYALALGSQGEELANSVAIDSSVVSPLELAGSIIGLLGQREDPTRVTDRSQEVNLVTRLKNTQDTVSGRFGNAGATLNNTLWAVIALDMYNRHYPAATVSYDVSKAVTYIQSQQSLIANDPLHPYGSFDESGWGADADSTAHALIALSNHVAADAEVVQNALTYLASKQLAGGGIDNWGDNSASTAAVIEALIALGIDPQSATWTKNGHTLVDSLLTHQQLDGSFNEDMGTYSLDNTAFALGALADLQAGSSKYRGVFTLPASSNRVISVTTPLPLLSGQDCDLTVKISNNGVTTQDTLVIAALYDSTGKMVTYSYGQYQLAAGAKQTVGLGFSVTTAAGFSVQVMAWDNWQQPNPLRSPVIMKIQ